MDVLWQELTFGIPDGPQVTRIVVRLLGAVLCGAFLGSFREKAGKAAGLRTHILVTLGSCAFVLAGTLYSMTSADLSRIIQGIVTGIGFIGGGAILKSDQHVRGLTSSAGIWIAAAVGVIVGLGELGVALFATVITVVIFTILKPLEKNLHEEPNDTAPPE